MGEDYKKAIHRMVDGIRNEGMLRRIYNLVAYIYRRKAD